jgi:phage baseplate assembly protein W
MQENYKLPIDFSRLFESDIRNLTTQNEKDSIRQNLELILTTSPGEHKFNPQFGCKIWNLDFERVESRGIWEENFIKFILDAVKQYETRICDVEVSVVFADAKREDLLMKAVFIKTKANIRIKSRLKEGGERFSFSYSLFLGPLNPD